MRKAGLRCVMRGKVVRTKAPDAKAPCPLDWVNRQLKAQRPNQLWACDCKYVSTWQGFIYVAFVITVFARRIVGWRVSSSMGRTDDIDVVVGNATMVLLSSHERFIKGLNGLAHPLTIERGFIGRDQDLQRLTDQFGGSFGGLCRGSVDKS